MSDLVNFFILPEGWRLGNDEIETFRKLVEDWANSEDTGDDSHYMEDSISLKPIRFSDECICCVLYHAIVGGATAVEFNVEDYDDDGNHYYTTAWMKAIYTRRLTFKLLDVDEKLVKFEYYDSKEDDGHLELYYNGPISTVRVSNDVSDVTLDLWIGMGFGRKDCTWRMRYEAVSELKHGGLKIYL